MTRRIRFFALALLASVAIGASACANPTAPDICGSTDGQGTPSHCAATGNQGGDV